MSQTIDTNVLVFASHAASPLNKRAQTFVAHVIAGPSLTYVFWPAIVGYLRIITHPRVLGAPLSADDALANVEHLISPSHVRVLGEGDSFWDSLRRVVTEGKARGKLVADAHLVALMRENGVSTIWSHDRDFRKFSG